MDPVTTNATNAEATRNDGPPAPTPEQDTARRAEITAPGSKYWSGDKAMVQELAGIHERESTRTAPQKLEQQEASPADKKIAELRRHPAFLDKNHKDHDDVMRQYRAAVAAADTPEETRAFTEAPLSEQRQTFGLNDPDPAVVPAVNVAEYNEAYGGHESDFLVAARQHGLEGKLVGELRDAGIRMALEAEGRAVTDEAWAVMEKRFAGRLTARQFNNLKAWWKLKVEGQ